MIDPTAAVRLALRTQILTTPGIPAISYEGRAYTPVLGTPFLRERLVPQTAEPLGLGPVQRVRNRGAWFVDVFYPNKVGESAVDAFVQLLLEQFPPAKQLIAGGVTTTIVKAQRAGTMPDNGSWLQVPVTVQWFADTYHTI